MRYWTCHWQFKYWNSDNNSEGEPVCSSGSNMFRKRGVSKGDTVYIVSLSDGQLYLGGRMIVKDILTRDEAVKLWKYDGLFDNTEWIVDPNEEGTVLHLHRRLSPDIVKQLQFVSKEGPRSPFFVSDTHLDNQSTRGIRELTQESAELLNRIIDNTDQIPISDDVITVTEVLEGKVNVQVQQVEAKKQRSKSHQLKRLLEVQLVGDVAIVTFKARKILQKQDVDQFGVQLPSLVKDEGHRRILVNFGKVEYLSSAALGTLVVLYKTVEDCKGKLAFSNLAPAMAEAFEITGFDQIFKIFESEQDALAYLQQEGLGRVTNVEDHNIAGDAVETANIPPNDNRMRFIDNELIRKIEAAAVALVTNELTLEGWSIHSREHEASLGFDLECTRDLETMHLEVKGTTEPLACFNLQASQYEAASKNKHWKIAVVTNALHPENAKVTFYDGDTFLNSFAIDPLQYRAQLKTK